MKSNATNYNLPPVRNNNALQVGTFSIASVLSPHLVLLVLNIVSAGTVTGVMQPSAAFCVWDFPTVSRVQRHCCSAAQ